MNTAESLARGIRTITPRGIFRRSTWRELSFHVVHLPIAVASFVWFTMMTTFAAVFAVTGVGSRVAATLFRSTGWVAEPTRAMSARLLARPVATAPAISDRSARATFRDPASWRAFAYSGLALILTGFTFVTSGVTLVVAIAALTFPLWRWPFAGLDGWAFTAPGAAVIVAAGGAVVLLAVWPPLNHALALTQALVIDALLGPTSSELRVAELAASRDATLENADSTLRRIERDLHDGTQARLISLAMLLGDALDRVRSGAHPASVEAQLSSAVAVTTDTLTELRALVQGIHPPMLDSGIDAALRSVVARSEFPIQLTVDAPRRLAPVVESIIYFAVLELLANVHKHASATRASISIIAVQGKVVAEVHDDGHGGAHIRADPRGGSGTGLAGLRERLRAVDGECDIHSPPGGPTTVRLTIWLKDRS